MSEANGETVREQVVLESDVARVRREGPLACPMCGAVSAVAGPAYHYDGCPNLAADRGTVGLTAVSLEEVRRVVKEELEAAFREKFQR